MTMLDHYQDLGRNMRAITVAREDSISGPRIGGAAPEGVSPPSITSITQYFLTVWLDEARGQEISLFLDSDAEESSPHSIYRNVSRLYSSETHVQAVMHPRSVRSRSSHLASELGGRALRIGPLSPDVAVEPGGELVLPSKIGGRPYFYYYSIGYMENLNRSFAEGFLLFLQVTWAGTQRSPTGLWPFDEYTFHLLAKETPSGITWRYGGASMLELCQSLVHKCRPILIAAEDSAAGNRIGGNPPGEMRLLINPSIYFATFVFDQSGHELSVFIAEDSHADISKRSRRLMAPSAGPVHLLLHPNSRRCLNPENRSGLSGHQLVVEKETDDLGSEPGPPDHKIGGAPYYHHNYSSTIIDDTRHAFDAGYFHALQLSLPGHRDARVRGTWPFGEYVFHIFAKPTVKDWEFLCGWA
jgi:hypothetical protein